MDSYRGVAHGGPMAIVYGRVYVCVISHCKYVFEAGSTDVRPSIVFPSGPVQECIIAVPGSVAFYDLSDNSRLQKSTIEAIWFPTCECNLPDDETLKEYFSLSLV